MHLRLLASASVLCLLGFGCFSKPAVEVGTTTVVSDADSEKMMAGSCAFDDKILCRFWTGWKELEDFSVRMTTTPPNGRPSGMTEMTMEMDGPERTHMIASDDAAVLYEVITIDGTTYTKNPDDSWTKFTFMTETDSALDVPSKESTFEFDLDDEATASTTTFTALGKEDCGSLTCYKYEIKEEGQAATTIWFDDREYRLRKMQVTDADGSVTVAEYSYDDVTITEPSPVVELPAMPDFP